MEIKTKIVSCHTADYKPFKQEVNSRMILPPLVFPAQTVRTYFGHRDLGLIWSGSDKIKKFEVEV